MTQGELALMHALMTLRHMPVRIVYEEGAEMLQIPRSTMIKVFDAYDRRVAEIARS